MIMKETFVWLIFAYLFGSLPTGYLLVKFYKGVDIRTIGSGNTGANNVRRVLGLGWGVFVAVVDMLKGAVGLLGAMAWGVHGHWLLSLIAFAGVIGHNYPVWLKFKGGKGVATSYGVLFFLWIPESFAIALMGGVVWYAIMRITRYVSLASVLSLFAVSIFFLILGAPFAYSIFAILLALLSAWRHRSNIDRLISGVESKI